MSTDHRSSSSTVIPSILAPMANEAEGVKRLPLVSVIVPALNEEDTIGQVLDRLLALNQNLEIIVVDDGSTDRTAQILATYGNRITLIKRESPGGKGSAIRLALESATGEVSVIQDADLEYRPEELIDVVEPIFSGKADIVLGTRFANGMPKDMAFPNKVVNVLLAWAARILYGVRITDEATCYKAVKTSELRRMDLKCTRFEFCPEVIAKSQRLGLRLAEAPISYQPRSKQAGKKIRWTDAPIAFWTLIRYRFGKF